MPEFVNCLRAEIIKSKNSFAVWLSLAGTIANAVIFFLLALLDINQLQGPVYENPWNYYILGHYEGIAFMMLPLYVIILATLVTFMEQRQRLFVQLNILPVTKWNLYLSKQVFIFLLFLAAHLLFMIGMLFSGFLLGIIRPGIRLLGHFPDFGQMLHLAGLTFWSILPLGALHYWISLRFSHFIIPLTIGIVGFVTVSILGPGWVYNSLIPYAHPILFVPAYKGEFALMQLGRSDLYLWLSPGFYLMFTVIGYLDWRRMDV